MSRHQRGPAQVALAGTKTCVLCPQPAARDIHLCTDDAADLDHLLDPLWAGDPARRIPASIPTYWARLDPAPGRGGGGQRRAPGFGSQPPCSLTAIVMRDRRSKPDAVAPAWVGAAGKTHYEQNGEPRPVETALANVTHGLWDELGYHGPELGNGDITAASGRKTPWQVTPGGQIDRDLTAVRALSAWLHAHRDRIAVHRDVAAIVEFLRDLRDQLVRATGDEPDRPVGRCNALLPRPGRSERDPCNEPIFAPVPKRDKNVDTGEDEITECARCGAKYGRVDRYRLARAERDGHHAASGRSA